MALKIEWDAMPRNDDDVWAIDLFAWAYDAIEAEGMLWRGQPPPPDFEHEPLVVKWRDHVRDESGMVSDHMLQELRTRLSGGSDESRVSVLLGLVVGIDRAFLGLRVNRPFPVVASPGMLAVLEEWGEKGSLERSADGLVLRKGSHWRAGRALSHYCSDLTRIRPDTAQRLEIRTTHRRIFTLGNLLRDQGPSARLSVAFVPTLHAADDLEFLPHDAETSHRFSVDLRGPVQANLTAGMDNLVRSLEEAKINIAVLPETVMNRSTCEALRKAVVRNNDEAVSAGRQPHLRFVAVGIGEPGTNFVTAFGADGVELLRQHKTHPWCLDEAQQKRYGLSREFGAVDRDEDIVSADTLMLLDDPGLGRTVALICEDLARGDTAWRLTTAATPTIVLTPLCDGSLQKRRWAFTAATRVTDEPGALVLVSNSFVLADRQHRVASPGAGGVKSAGIGIVCHPDDWHQTGIVTSRPAPGSFQRRLVHWNQAWG
jgi:predicted amidohydrolase